MIRKKAITVDGREVIVRELTVAQIRDLMDQFDKEAGSVDVIDLMFAGRIPFDAVKASTGLDAEALSTFSPSELDQIIKGVEDINPFFANMITRLSKMGEQIIRERTSTPLSAN